ncbi:MAG: ISAs1 family transposase [Mariprofundaceae bacterium]|nr:ISAs1 family transposase [Mariprofundaceae bacterium]
MSPSIVEHFSSLQDHRIERHKKHQLIDIVVLSLTAVISGAEGWKDIVEFGESKLEWLRQFVPLKHGIPVDDTVARIISGLSTKGFQDCFQSWIQSVVQVTEGEIISIDGKTHRRSHDKKSGKKALHMVSAWANENNLVLGQVKTREKSNEITAIPELLKVLELKGCIVTIDAMGCQEKIIGNIVDKEGGYAIAVKGNQGKLHESIVDFFDTAECHGFKDVNYRYTETLDKGHGRVEMRRYWISDHLDSLHEPQRWKNLAAIGMVESERHKGDKVSIERRYYILSFFEISLFANAVRSHWGIENKVHWVLDVTFKEDNSRIRRGNATHNMGVIRHMALNLLKKEKAKRSLAGKRLRAAFNDKYRTNVLFSI